MKKFYLLFFSQRKLFGVLKSVCFTALLLLNFTLFAQTTYPYSNTLDGTNTSGLSILGNAQYTNGYLRLTPYADNQSGFLIFDNASLSSIQGIHVEFEFAAQGAVADNATGADGIGFFLYDATKSINTSSLPPSGGSLGYSFSTDGALLPNTNVVAGVPGGYLAIGLDEYGNFKSESNRKNGFPDNNNSFFGYSGSVSFVNHISIRGAAGKSFSSYNPATPSGTVPADNCWGYPIMYTTSGNVASQARYQGMLATSSTDQSTVTAGSAGVMIPGDANTKIYSYSNTPTIENSVILSNSLSGNTDPIWDPANSNYRKAYIDVIPGTNNSISGFYVTVAIQSGNTKTTVINNYFYPNSLIKYLDNSYLYSSTNNGNGYYAQVDGTAPTNYKFGFSASTGSSKNLHAIHNLYISLPSNIRLNGDYTSNCINGGSFTISSILDNDYVLESTGGENYGVTYVDKSSVRFNSSANTVATINSSVSSVSDLPIGSQMVSTNGDVSTVTYKNNAGVWVYNSENQNVTYTRAIGYTGVASALYSAFAIGSDESSRGAGTNLNVGLNGPYAHNDTVTLWAPTVATTSATKNMAVLDNDTSLIYQNSNSSMVTAGAPALDASSFYFTDASGSSNFGQSYSDPNTSGINWSFVPTTENATLTLTNTTFHGMLNAYYRIKTSSGCLSDVDTIVLTIPYSLPVKFADFTATNINNLALLKWSTATEINNAGFTVERSSNGLDWQSIGTVASLAKEGNSSIPLDYSYTDNNPLSGINYYRIKQTDLDNVGITYSEIQNLTFQGLSDLKVYPNPAVSIINIANATMGNQFRVIGMDGKVYFSGIINRNPQQLNISNLSAGVYIVQILNDRNIIGTVKFKK